MRYFKIMGNNAVIFSDLDGTLLDHDTYSFEQALPALKLVEKKNIPLVICTSKTRSEIDLYRQLLRNSSPFISENGGGIFIPEGYFKAGFEEAKEIDGYLVVELGTPYEQLVDALKTISKETGIKITGFSDMSVSELSEATGMDEKQAGLAKQRDYSEPFIVDASEQDIKTIRDKIDAAGYNYTRGGRFHHIMGNSDKGKAVRILSGIYEKETGGVKTIALGDSLNDLPMLKEAEIPVLVQKKDGNYDRNIKLNNLVWANGIGPVGWNSAILKLFMNYD